MGAAWGLCEGPERGLRSLVDRPRPTSCSQSPARCPGCRLRGAGCELTSLQQVSALGQ